MHSKKTICTTHARCRGVVSLYLLAYGFGLTVANEGPDDPQGGVWTFTDDTVNVSLAYTHGYSGGDPSGSPDAVVGGITIGDINDDGWDDIFATTGDTKGVSEVNPNPNKLFISDQDGTYTESAAAWGLDDDDTDSAGPLIVDVDNDGWNDLLVGGHRDADNIRVYLNSGILSFVDGTAGSGLPGSPWSVGMSSADIDYDGDLDLFIARSTSANTQLLYSNNGSAQFSDITAVGLDGDTPSNSFTPSFADLNLDGRVDLSLASDAVQSRYYHQTLSNIYDLQPTAPITDQNGMGGAIGDFDNDGDFDWFVTSIHYLPAGKNGNRLYRNDGSGAFTDFTESAGVRDGSFGWGACFADFNNDMHLDIYMVNGYYGSLAVFLTDPAKMFINGGSNAFSEMGVELNVADTNNGRSVLCFDNERDGDIDILIHNNSGPSVFLRNDRPAGDNYLQVKLRQDVPNADAIGAIIRVTAGGVTQMRQIASGGNYGASLPTAQHFGLGTNGTVTTLSVTWPDGLTDVLNDVDANQYLVIQRPGDNLHSDGFED